MGFDWTLELQTRPIPANAFSALSGVRDSSGHVEITKETKYVSPRRMPRIWGSVPDMR
jgi:hypothetical protein